MGHVLEGAQVDALVVAILPGRHIAVVPNDLENPSRCGGYVRGVALVEIDHVSAPFARRREISRGGTISFRTMYVK